MARPSSHAGSDDIEALTKHLFGERLAAIDADHENLIREIRRDKASNLNTNARKTKELQAELDRDRRILDAHVDAFFEARKSAGRLSPPEALDKLRREISGIASTRQGVHRDRLRRMAAISGHSISPAVESNIEQVAASSLAAAQRLIDARLAAIRIAENRDSRTTPLPEATISEGVKMKEYGPWHVIRELGSGGQGTVYLVRRGLDPRVTAIETFGSGCREFAIAATRESVHFTGPKNRKPPFLFDNREKIGEILAGYDREIAATQYGALKVVRTLDDLAADEKVLARLQREVEALKKISHPSLVQVLQENLEDRWFVMTYLPDGHLGAHRDRFRGRTLLALHAFRSLVEGVAALHAEGLVHRDIKPENIFLGRDGRLVLGDLGIVFDPTQEERLSSAYEKVGTSDWMAPWARVRQDEVRPTADMFSLGKVFWAMVTAKTVLPFWWHKKDEYSLRKLFPDEPEVWFGEWILDDTVVEEERNCISTATALLERIDYCIRAVSGYAQPLGNRRYCRVCGLGAYVQVGDERNPTQAHNFGVHPTGDSGFRIFTCDRCGHVDLFQFPKRDEPPSWWKDGKPPIPAKKK